MDETTNGDPGPTVLASFRLLCYLVAVVLVLALVSVFAWHRSENPDDEAAPASVISSITARDTGMQGAASLTKRVLSYDWKTLDADMSTAQAVLAPSIRSQYVASLDGVRAQTVKNHVRLSATIASTSIISASTTKVQALVFVDQTTTARSPTRPRLDQTRVRVTLTRHDGTWRLSRMEAF